MAHKLDIGSVFPRITLDLASGGTAAVPEPGARYTVILFYRGHW